MLSTSKNVLFPDHNHLLTTSADDPTLYHPKLKVLGHRQWLLTGGYDLEIGHF